MLYSQPLREKIRNQIALTGSRIGLLRTTANSLITYLEHLVQVQAARLRCGHPKPIAIDYTNIPKGIVRAIQSTGLDRRIWWLSRIRFECDAAFCHEVENFESGIYSILSYIVYALKLARPDLALKDKFEDLVKKSDQLDSRVKKAVLESQGWVEVFKSHRRVTAHRSPKTCYLELAVSKPGAVASFILVNNENQERQDLFDLLALASKIQHLFVETKWAIEAWLV